MTAGENIWAVLAIAVRETQILIKAVLISQDHHISKRCREAAGGPVAWGIGFLLVVAENLQVSLVLTMISHSSR